MVATVSKTASRGSNPLGPANLDNLSFVHKGRFFAFRSPFLILKCVCEFHIYYH